MGFNDRLAELQGDAPSWAQEDTGGGGDTGAVDIEMGATKPNKKKQKKTAAGETSSSNLAWAMDDDNDTAAAAGGSSNDTAGGWRTTRTHETILPRSGRYQIGHIGGNICH